GTLGWTGRDPGRRSRGVSLSPPQRGGGPPRREAAAGGLARDAATLCVAPRRRPDTECPDVRSHEATHFSAHFPHNRSHIWRSLEKVSACPKGTGPLFADPILASGRLSY